MCDLWRAGRVPLCLFFEPAIRAGEPVGVLA